MISYIFRFYFVKLYLCLVRLATSVRFQFIYIYLLNSFAQVNYVLKTINIHSTPMHKPISTQEYITTIHHNYTIILLNLLCYLPNHISHPHILIILDTTNYSRYHNLLYIFFYQT